MNTNHYRQCMLVNGEATTVAWIPDTLAKVGKWIEAKADKSLWYVYEAWNRLPAAVVEERSRDYRNQRKASDI